MDTLNSKFNLSRKVIDGPVLSMNDVWGWVDEQILKQSMAVDFISLSELKGWNINPDSENITHDSGRFFSIAGIEWNDKQYPVMLQPEIGILGVIATTYKEIFHILIQAKIEPGNINGIQLSPTVQATRSNYSQVHGGNVPPYLSYFFKKDIPIISDQFQSEQGRRYFEKKNRNVILEVDTLLPEKEGFIWVTLGQFHQLFKRDNLINSCLRSVYSTIPWELENKSKLSDVDILAIMRNERENAPGYGEIISLNKIKGWEFRNGKFLQSKIDGYEIKGISIQAGTREICSWTQPVVCELKSGVYGLVVTTYNDAPHFVLRFSNEPGYREKVEWSTTWINRDGDEGSNPEFWHDCFEKSCNSRVVFDKELSEEGGRFYESTFRHLVYYIADIHTVIPDGYVLMSFEQVTRFMKHANYFSMELRSLISCLDFEWFND